MQDHSAITAWADADTERPRAAAGNRNHADRLLCELVWYFAANLNAPRWILLLTAYRLSTGGQHDATQLAPADIIAGLRKKGTSLAEVSRGPGWRLPRWQMR